MQHRCAPCYDEDDSQCTFCLGEMLCGAVLAEAQVRTSFSLSSRSKLCAQFEMNVERNETLAAEAAAAAANSTTASNSTSLVRLLRLVAACVSFE